LKVFKTLSTCPLDLKHGNFQRTYGDEVRCGVRNAIHASRNAFAWCEEHAGWIVFLAQFRQTLEIAP
jgi:hypothetical protein